VICGPLTGGAFLAELMAVELGIDFAFSERITSDRTGLFPVDYRIKAALRPALEGRRVAIVDDAISAGSAVRGTYREVAACGGTPVVLGAVVVLGPAAREFAAAQGMPLERLGELPLAVWLPAACPLCATGTPLTDP
jgi:orotate phosphoribosyltransferase